MRIFRARLALPAAIGASLFLTAAIVGQALATTIIDLTAAGSTGTANGAIYKQGQPVPVSGTGVLNPFLRVSTNQDIEQGFSTDDNNNQMNNDDSWTKALRLSVVPTIQLTPGGTIYREFLLDINQTKPGALLSLDEVKLFLANTPNLTGYIDGGPLGGGTFDQGTFPMAFSQGDNVIKLNYSLEAGSGKPDMTLLVPDSAFAGPNYCAYAAPTCTTWMGFYTKFGSYNSSEWPNNDGFEEWATIIRPVVQVSKTANASSAKDCTWDITKDVDKTHVDIASGGTATFNYTVSVTHSCVDSAATVTGNITITNPLTLPDGTATPNATIASLPTDKFTPGDISATVSCPVSFPYTLGSGATLTCTYTLNLGSPTNGTNTATVTLTDTSLAPFTASVPVTFGAPTVTDGSVTVVDDKTDPNNPVTLGTATWTDPNPIEFKYSLDKQGVAGKCTDYTNTATFTTNTTNTTGSADKTVTVCVGKDLTVAKTATPTFTRTFTWGISKDVDQTKVTIAAGGTATFNYTVNVTHNAGTDSAWALDGTITVTNPNDWEDIVANVSDAVNNGGTCSVTGGTGVTVPKGGHVDLTYHCTYASAPNPLSGTNTATATWNKDTYFTPTGSASGTAAADFSGNPTTIVDGSVNVVDDKTDPNNPVTLGTVSYTDPSPTSFHYSLTKSGVAGKCTDYTNTATFTTNTTNTTGKASQTVTVCVGLDLTVEKTATPAFTRTYKWDIDKLVDKTEIDIANGGTATFNYTVRVTHDAGTDSGWTVTGTITVHNPNDFEAITTDVTDKVDNGGTCVVTGGTAVVVAAGGDVSLAYTCTYANAPNPLSGTNTATATWDKDAFFTPTGSASGTAPFTFLGAPTTIVDGSVTVVDDKTDPNNPVILGTVSYTDTSPFDFPYSLSKPGVGGKCTDYTNIATFTTNTTKTTGSADQTVRVCVGLDLTVEKTATPTFTRTFHWDITKDVDNSSVTINNGDSFTFNYTVNVTHDAGTDSGWAITGTITVHNPNDWEAITADLSDAVDNGGTCTVTNGTGVIVPASGSASRDYSCTWSSAPSSSSGINTGTATWDKDLYFTPTGSASGTKSFAFTTPTTLIDESVTVNDPVGGGNLGTVSYTDPSPTTFHYSRTITPADYTGCGTFTYDNTATITTNDTNTTDSASQKVSVTVINCGVFGKTPGFWRSNNGHAILDTNHDGNLDTPVTIGAGLHSYTVTTIQASDKILSNNDCVSGSPLIFYPCTGPTGLVAGLNVNSFEVLGAQTLALTYNINLVTGYTGQTINGLGCSAYLTSALTSAPISLSGSSTVNAVLTAANNLIGNSFRPSGTATQQQVGAMDSLLSCLNREGP